MIEMWKNAIDGQLINVSLPDDINATRTRIELSRKGWLFVKEEKEELESNGKNNG